MHANEATRAEPMVALSHERLLGRVGGQPETLARGHTGVLLKQPRTKGPTTAAEKQAECRRRKKEEEEALRDMMRGLTAENERLRQRLLAPRSQASAAAGLGLPSHRTDG
jgi:hypothetical protein